jgi:formylglycine-generating enzyme required for sulfatase activity
MARPLPETFGRYQILRPLGEGGMGSVHLARDSQLDRLVALKVPRLGGDDKPAPDDLKRFLREARAAAALFHANLCPIFDVGEVDGTPYLTMAYLEGRLLSELVRERKSLSEHEAALIVGKLALAMDVAHSKGVIHRDLKPSNVMVNPHGEPVIMDFGLARIDQTMEARLTKPGTLLGTPAYMAPEQLQGDPQAVGPPCDIYALGVILYELVTGRLPFEGSVLSVLGQILTQAPPPPSKHRSDLAPEIEAICLKAMAKKPEDRYASMADLAGALAGVLRAGHDPQTARPAPGAEPAAAPVSSAVGDSAATLALATLFASGNSGKHSSLVTASAAPEATFTAGATAPTPRSSWRERKREQPWKRRRLLGLSIVAGAGATLALWLIGQAPFARRLGDVAAPGARTSGSVPAPTGEAPSQAPPILKERAGPAPERSGVRPESVIKAADASIPVTGPPAVTKELRPKAGAAPSFAKDAAVSKAAASTAAAGNGVGRKEGAAAPVAKREARLKEGAAPPLGKVAAASNEATSTTDAGKGTGRKEAAAAAVTKKEARPKEDARAPLSKVAMGSKEKETATTGGKAPGSEESVPMPVVRKPAESRSAVPPPRPVPAPLVEPGILTTRVGRIKLKRLPAGTFLLGSPEGEGIPSEHPQRLVRISRPFYLGVFEVTQAQYHAVMDVNPSWFSIRGGGRQHVAGQSTDQHPVHNVSWLDAVRFCNTLSEQENVKPFYVISGDQVQVPDWDGPGYRLPTEAEWEYACRAGTKTRYSFGDGESELPEHAWYERFAGGRTHVVGQKQPNAWGLYDMHGNVWEWCWDVYGESSYQHASDRDPKGPAGGTRRVLRGGSFNDYPIVLRSATRGRDVAGNRDGYNGLRIARSGR